MIREKDSFRGCLIGCAIGDAIGAPVEMLGAADVEVYIDKHVDRRCFDGVIRKEGTYRWQGFPFGQYTDDTQLTVELAESLVENKGLNMDGWGRRISGAFQRNSIVGSGRSTRESAYRLVKGIPWEKAGAKPPAAGNGSAVRSAPIGLFFRDPSEIMLKASDQSYITHQADVCCAGAVAIASAVRFAIENHDPLSILEMSANVVLNVDIGLSTAISELFEFMQEGKSSDEILDMILKIQPPDRFPGITPWVVSSVLWSLYASCVHAQDFFGAIKLAIWPGGDTDSTAAMAGAIVGARIGASNIEDWASEMLRDHGKPKCGYLMRLADRLYECSIR